MAGNWSDSGAFNADNGLVTLNGTNQSVLGSTTFYQFNKTIPALAGPYTLTFDSTSGTLQKFTNKLTLLGNTSNDLYIASNGAGSNLQADIALGPGGTQLINYLNVSYSNAAGIPVTFPGITLHAHLTSTDSGHNTNWFFGGDNITWIGVTSTDWNDPSNWDLGFVPIAGDFDTIPGGTPFEPTLTSSVTAGSLTIAPTATLTLAGNNLTVNTTFLGTGILINNGTIILNGSETVTATTVSPSPPLTAGTFEYIGDNSGGYIISAIF